MESMETPDLFRSACQMCLGARLQEVKRQGGTVIFCLQGQDLTTRDMDYRMGRLLVEPLRLRENLNLLRDVVHGRLGHA